LIAINWQFLWYLQSLWSVC